MFVCHCEVVSDGEVAAAVDAGADSVDAVGVVTGAGTRCGGCHESIEAILAQRCAGCPRALSAVA